MTVKEELIHLVDLLNEENAREALDYVRWLLEEEEHLTPEELERVRQGEEELARGERVGLADLKRELGL